MRGTAAAPRCNMEIRYRERDFQALRRLLHQRTGISLGESRRCMVYSRLARRVRSLDLDSFAAYVDRLRTDELEVRFFIGALSTHVTEFFREAHHFALLTREVLPELLASRSGTRCLRVWSAGCSSGEEPYSIAATVLETLGDVADWDVRILATDLDGRMIERGRRGTYPAESASSLPASARRWFRRGTGPNRGLVRVTPELRRLIRFERLNLLDPWPMKRPFDVIFCRNVLIYFDRETQQSLYRRFASQLAQDGYLFLGHSESLAQLSEHFVHAGQTVYRRAR